MRKKSGEKSEHKREGEGEGEENNKETSRSALTKELGSPSLRWLHEEAQNLFLFCRRFQS